MAEMWHDSKNVYIDGKPFRWFKLWYYPHMAVYSLIIDKFNRKKY
jgi:hypothetical protein